jgi:hypothetical protein
MAKLVDYEWRPVAGFPEYEMTSLGFFRKTGSHIQISTHFSGGSDIETVQLTHDGKRYHRSVKQLVIATFPGAVY